MEKELPSSLLSLGYNKARYLIKTTIMNLFQAFQVTMGIGTLVTLVFVIIRMAHGRRGAARRLSRYTIGFLVSFVLLTAYTMAI